MIRFCLYQLLCLNSLAIGKVIVLALPGAEPPTALFAITWMVYIVPGSKPLSIVVVEVVLRSAGGDPLLGTAVTVYPVTGGLLAGTTGGVHVTVIDEVEVAVAVTPVGGGGTARKKIEL